MPREARLDGPGALHQVMVRGIERTAIVFDDEDRLEFLNWIGKAADKTGTVIYVWAMMTNHAHLLLRIGLTGLLSFIRKVLTGRYHSTNGINEKDICFRTVTNRYSAKRSPTLSSRSAISI
jgi:REP element-mobilizing transposase RayT